MRDILMAPFSPAFQNPLSGKARPRLLIFGLLREAAKKFGAKRVIGSTFFFIGLSRAGCQGNPITRLLLMIWFRFGCLETRLGHGEGKKQLVARRGEKS